jgi:hypothetical protein
LRNKEVKAAMRKLVNRYIFCKEKWKVNDIFYIVLTQEVVVMSHLLSLIWTLF